VEVMLAQMPYNRLLQLLQTLQRRVRLLQEGKDSTALSPPRIPA
jgi:hypothetical protein